MSRHWFILSILLVFSFSTSGCFETNEAYYYSVTDLEENSNSIETSDVLFTMTLNSGEADMDISGLVIIIDPNDGSHTCVTSGTGGSCLIVQSGLDNSLWEIGEVLNITENGVDICSNHCILYFSVDGPEGVKIVGPTIMNTT